MILLGLAVFGVDLGRMYMIKSEMQAFADAAALSAAVEMDGSKPGFARARAAVHRLTVGPNAMRWDMGSRPITDIDVRFAKGDAPPGPRSWQPEPESPSDYRLVRVVATAPAPLIFLRVFQPLRPSASIVVASSVAMQTSGAARLVE